MPATKTTARSAPPAGRSTPPAARSTPPAGRSTPPAARSAAAGRAATTASTRAAKTAAKAAAKPARAAAKPAAARPAAAKASPAKAAAKPVRSPAPSAQAGPGVGDPAPDFSLAADDGKTYSLAGLRGSRFVLYFYPRDSTPGCTTEACDFRDRHATFAGAKVPVLGVSGDDLKAHAKFRSKHALTFPLLTDPDHRVATAYGAYGEKMMYGRAMQGIVRSTFVIGPTGVIEAAWRPVKVPGHAEAVLQVIRGAG